MALTADEIRHLARLAQLELTPQEVQRLTRELAGILDWIAMLDELPPEDGKQDAPIKKPPGTVLRADEPRAAPAQKDLLRNAPAVDGAYFSVPKIVE